MRIGSSGTHVPTNVVLFLSPRKEHSGTMWQDAADKALFIWTPLVPNSGYSSSNRF